MQGSEQHSAHVRMTHDVVEAHCYTKLERQTREHIALLHNEEFSIIDQEI